MPFSLRLRHLPPVRMLLAAGAVGALLAGCGSSAPSPGSTTSASSGSSGSSGSSDSASRVGSDLTYPPYAFLDGGKPDGFDPQIVTALAKRMDRTVAFQDTRFEQLIAGLKGDRFDVIASALYITSTRAKEVDFIPYFSTGNSIVVAKGATPIADLTGLCGKSVAVIKGGQIVTQLRTTASSDCTNAGKKSIDVREFTTDPEASQALISGQVGAQVTDAAVASTLGSSTDGKVEVSSTALLYPQPVGLAVKKGNSALAQQLTDALEAMKSDGSYDALLEKYNLAPVDEGQLSQILGD